MLKSFVLVAALTLTALSPASAATVAVTAQANAFDTGITANYGKGNVYAGTFKLNADYGDGVLKPFVAFCLSPFTWLSLPKDYVEGLAKAELTTQAVKRLRALVNGAWTNAWTQTSAGAFQLAVWEIVAEKDTSKGLNLTDGTFVATTSYATAFSDAQALLGKVADGTFRAKGSTAVFLSADNTQDLLTDDLPAPVPLPGGFGLLALGLAALAAKGRARRS